MLAGGWMRRCMLWGDRIRRRDHVGGHLNDGNNSDGGVSCVFVILLILILSLYSKMLILFLMINLWLGDDDLTDDAFFWFLEL